MIIIYYSNLPLIFFNQAFVKINVVLLFCWFSIWCGCLGHPLRCPPLWVCQWIQSCLLNIMIFLLEPTGAPAHFTVNVGETTSQSISLSWGKVNESDRNGIITGYKVVYQALPNGWSFTAHVSVGAEGERTTTTLYGLKPFTNYTIRVLAYTIKGDGPPSPEKTVQTKEDSKLHNNANHLVEILLIYICSGINYLCPTYL